jgi:hypothetical protein
MVCQWQQPGPLAASCHYRTRVWHISLDQIAGIQIRGGTGKEMTQTSHWPEMQRHRQDTGKLVTYVNNTIICNKKQLINDDRLTQLLYTQIQICLRKWS